MVAALKCHATMKGGMANCDRKAEYLIADTIPACTTHLRAGIEVAFARSITENLKVTSLTFGATL